MCCRRGLICFSVCSETHHPSPPIIIIIIYLSPPPIIIFFSSTGTRLSPLFTRHSLLASPSPFARFHSKGVQRCPLSVLIDGLDIAAALLLREKEAIESLSETMATTMSIGFLILWFKWHPTWRHVEKVHKLRYLSLPLLTFVIGLVS